MLTKTKWQKVEDVSLRMTPQGMAVQCRCGEFVPIVDEEFDVCGYCGCKWRVVVEYGDVRDIKPKAKDILPEALDIGERVFV